MGAVSILSTNIFGQAANAPTFVAGDNLYITLSGPNAFQGVATVYIGGANTAGALARNILLPGGVTATNEKMFTLTAANLVALDFTDAGNSDVNLALKLWMSVTGATAIEPRTVTASAVDLALTGSGNGTVNLGSAGVVFKWDQNGTLFRCSYYRQMDNARQWYKFTNTSGNDVTVEVRYLSNDGTTVTDWTDFGSKIPQNGVLTIASSDVDVLFTQVTSGTTGWVEFRVHTPQANCTGMVNAKVGDSFFNVPMMVRSTGNTGNNIWR
jgi:hypothetical protein